MSDAGKPINPGETTKGGFKLRVDSNQEASLKVDGIEMSSIPAPMLAAWLASSMGVGRNPDIRRPFVSTYWGTTGTPGEAVPRTKDFEQIGDSGDVIVRQRRPAAITIRVPQKIAEKLGEWLWGRLGYIVEAVIYSTPRPYAMLYRIGPDSTVFIRRYNPGDSFGTNNQRIRSVMNGLSKMWEGQ